MRFQQQPRYIKGAAIDVIGLKVSRHNSPAKAPIDVKSLLLLAARDANKNIKF